MITCKSKELKTIKFVFENWKCCTNDKEIMLQAISRSSKLSDSEIVKVKANRVIYKFEVANHIYYAKLNLPKSFIYKIKEFFRPKSRIEYNAAVMLRNMGIPIVNMVGWGKQGYRSILVSACPEGESISTIKDYWLKISTNAQKKKEFLHAICPFIDSFNKTNLVHTDFDPANVLAVEAKTSLNFLLIDPFGISKSSINACNIFKNGLFKLISSFLFELTRNEKISFLIESNLIKDQSEYDQYLEAFYLHHISVRKKRWDHRRNRLMSVKPNRQLHRIESNNSVLFIKKDIAGTPLIKVEDITYVVNNEKFDTLECNRSEAQTLWFSSLYLDSININHIGPIAWKQSNVKDLLLIEKTTKYSPYINTEYTEDFIKLCKTAKIEINNPSEKILIKENRPYLKLIPMI